LAIKALHETINAVKQPIVDWLEGLDDDFVRENIAPVNSHALAYKMIVSVSTVAYVINFSADAALLSWRCPGIATQKASLRCAAIVRHAMLMLLSTTLAASMLSLGYSGFNIDEHNGEFTTLSEPKMRPLARGGGLCAAAAALVALLLAVSEGVAHGRARRDANVPGADVRRLSLAARLGNKLWTVCTFRAPFCMRTPKQLSYIHLYTDEGMSVQS
jgi:hypothetical protein